MQLRAPRAEMEAPADGAAAPPKKTMKKAGAASGSDRMRRFSAATGAKIEETDDGAMKVRANAISHRMPPAGWGAARARRSALFRGLLRVCCRAKKSRLWC